LIPCLKWGFFFFLEGEDSDDDHGLGRLVELRFKAPPGTSYTYITIHLMSVPASEVGYTSAKTGTGVYEVVAKEKKK
jgi:hypothetical protein